jgi:pyruvate,water dikinase
MAVLIQPLIDADCAGVCFTVDPVHIQPDELLVTAAWGLGIGVVEGRAPTDTFLVRRSDLSTVDAHIADKHTQFRFEPGQGIQRVEVAPDRRSVACLPHDWLHRIAQFGLAVEQFFEQPQDIEWAIAGEQFVLLQSRPVSTLTDEARQRVAFPIVWESEEERRRLWWLCRQSHRRSDILLPAEIDMLRVDTRGGQAAVIHGGGRQTRWRKIVNGRTYMARADSEVGPGESRVRHAALMDLFERLHDQGVTMWEYWGPEIVRATERLGAFDAASVGGEEHAQHLENALATAERHWFVHTLVPRHGRIESFVEAHAQISAKDRIAAEENLPLLLQGAETVQTRCVEQLYDLAAMSLAHPEVAECLRRADENRHAQLLAMPEAAGFMRQLTAFMTMYGDRTAPVPEGRDGANLYELALPWREAPEHVLSMVARYLPLAAQGEAASPRRARDRALHDHEARIDALCEGADAELARRFRQLISYMRRDAAYLDEHNHYIDQLSVGQHAQAVIHAGRWLTARGDLHHPYDAFWLEAAEVLAALRSTLSSDLNEVIATRQAWFRLEERRITPPYIGMPGAAVPEWRASEAPRHEPASPTPPKPPNSLRGQAASRGKRSGRAHVAHSVASPPDFGAGDILVAPNVGPFTGPYWSPLLALLGGIALDGGNPAEHAAITAREFGVPMVCGLADATRRIPHGAWVTCDGDSGTVTWGRSPGA